MSSPTIPSTNVVGLVLAPSGSLVTSSVTDIVNTIPNVLCVFLKTALTLFKDSVTLRVPDYFGRGNLDGSKYNIYYSATTLGLTMNAYFPVGNTTGDAVQGKAPKRVVTNFGPLVGTPLTLLMKARAGEQVCIQWNGPALVNLGTIGMSKEILETLDIFLEEPFCPLPLGTGESLVKHSFGYLLTLNRAYTAGSELGILQLETKPLYTNGSYTITSNNTAIIPSSTGLITKNASFIIYVKPIMNAYPDEVELNITINGLGKEAIIHIIPSLM